MTSDLRDELRAKADASLYFFCKFVLGFKDLTPQFHGQLARYVSDPSRRFKLIVAPRGHLKTSICTIAYALWRALRNPNLRILVIANTATNAQHMVRAIKRMVETSELLRELYPEALPRPDSKWTESELEFNRASPWPEATIESIGRGGTVTSRHYDIIIEDDLLAPEGDADISPDLVNDTAKWHKYATGLMIDPSASEQVISANRWLYDDYVAYIMQHEKWFLPCLYFSAYQADGTPWWPERFPATELDRILEQQGPRIFSVQYMNDPVHEDSRSFDPAWLRFYVSLPTPLRTVTAIDPAITQKIHGDFTAIITVGADVERNRYVVDARRGRWGIDEMIDHLFEVHRTWKPVKVGLETVVFQRALLWPIREAMRRENYTFSVTELQPSGRVTKDARIMALHEYFANGSLWLNKLHRELLDELRGWPAVTHDDMLDALSYAMQLLVYPSIQETPSYQDPFTFDYIRRELDRKRQATGSVFLWPLGQPSRIPVRGRGLPQTLEEVEAALEALDRQE